MRVKVNMALIEKNSFKVFCLSICLSVCLLWLIAETVGPNLM